jgi:hypothetical protein
MTILDNYIFETCNDAIRFRDTKTVVKNEIFEKAVFHCFHFLIRNPEFGVQMNTTRDTLYQKLKATTKDSVTFESVESVEEYVSNIQNPDRLVTESRQIPFERENILKLFSFPLVHTNQTYNFQTDASKEYIKRLMHIIAPKLIHLPLKPFSRKCLLFSIILSRTIIITDGVSRDIYNPSAGDDLEIMIK